MNVYQEIHIQNSAQNDLKLHISKGPNSLQENQTLTPCHNQVKPILRALLQLCNFSLSCRAEFKVLGVLTQLKKILLNELSDFMEHTMNFNFMETTQGLF